MGFPFLIDCLTAPLCIITMKKVLIKHKQILSSSAFKADSEFQFFTEESSGPFDYAITDIPYSGKEATGLNINAGRECTVIAVGNAEDKNAQKSLFAAGTARCFPLECSKRILAYISALEKKRSSNKRYGTFLALESRPNVIMILESILESFGYTLETAPGTVEFFSKIEGPDIVFSAADLGAGFDLNAFIRMSHASPSMKRIPFIAHKDMDSGIFVNEMISGLNRFTNFILGTDELYSFILDLLFRKSVTDKISRIVSTADYKSNENLACAPLPHIFHSLKNIIFSGKSPMRDESFAGLLECSCQISEVLILTEPLRWLGPDTHSGGTCGIC